MKATPKVMLARPWEELLGLMRPGETSAEAWLPEWLGKYEQTRESPLVKARGRKAPWDSEQMSREISS
jgi:hypothetical protein